ncbi:2-deoxy-5-keto-D-gluconate 6-phosphate aldolase domain-containing protein [Caulobacter segnis]
MRVCSTPAGKTRHELLLELILPAGMDSDSRTVARAIRRLCSLGIRPDWWKLEPPAGRGGLARDRDRHQRERPRRVGAWCCSGLSAPGGQELLASFEVVAPFPIVKGFRGRPDHLLRCGPLDRLAGRIDDEGGGRRARRQVQGAGRRLAALCDAPRREAA